MHFYRAAYMQGGLRDGKRVTCPSVRLSVTRVNCDKTKAPSEKSSIMTNRKSHTSFPMSLIWTSYVAPNPSKGASKAQIWPISAITWKRCEIGCKLVLISIITNRKSHMGFRLVPKSVTLNDLERCNDRYLAFFSPNSVALRADYVKVVEDRPIQSATEM